MFTTILQYFMPKSMTFWAAFAMLLSGLIIAASTVFPSLASIAVMLQQAWHMTGTQLIDLGLAGIGVRKAIGTISTGAVSTGK